MKKKCNLQGIWEKSIAIYNLIHTRGVVFNVMQALSRKGFIANVPECSFIIIINFYYLFVLFDKFLWSVKDFPVMLTYILRGMKEIISKLIFALSGTETFFLEIRKVCILCRLAGQIPNIFNKLISDGVILDYFCRRHFVMYHNFNLKRYQLSTLLVRRD